MDIRSFMSVDVPAIHHLLTSNRWDYFLEPVIDENGLRVRDEKYFASDTTQTLVYLDSEENLKGFIRFFDVENSGVGSPEFIVNIDERARGKGVGKLLVRRGIEHIFDTYAKVRRIEATTRVDNKAMQRVFELAGFRHEATYRKDWPVAEGKYVDSLGYAILREEFKPESSALGPIR